MYRTCQRLVYLVRPRIVTLGYVEHARELLKSHGPPRFRDIIIVVKEDVGGLYF